MCYRYFDFKSNLFWIFWIFYQPNILLSISVKSRVLSGGRIAIPKIMSSSKLKTGGRSGHDRMVVGFTTTYAISDYHHWSCEFESRTGDVYSIQHHVIKFVSDLRQVCGFLRALQIPPPKNWPRDNWNIVESGVKHKSSDHDPKVKTSLDTL